MRDVRIHDDSAALAADAASTLIERLVGLQEAGEIPHVCLTGGSTAALVHRAIAAHPDAGRVAWHRVMFWWGDERFVAHDDPDRNALDARVALLDPVGATMVHEMPAADQSDDVEEAARAYEVILEDHGPALFDVVMLGVGEDGHVASLFPGRPEIDATEGATVAVHDSPKPPPLRISLTLDRLNRARSVWFLVSGEPKSAIVATLLGTGADSEPPLPAERVVGTGDQVWFLDAAAAAGLER